IAETDQKIDHEHQSPYGDSSEQIKGSQFNGGGRIFRPIPHHFDELGHSLWTIDDEDDRHQQSTTDQPCEKMLIPTDALFPGSLRPIGRPLHRLLPSGKPVFKLAVCPLHHLVSVDDAYTEIDSGQSVNE